MFGKYKRPRTHPNVTWIDLTLEPFIPLGFHSRKQRVVLWPRELRRKPVRYINNNSLVYLAVTLYDALHQGPAWWVLVHLALGAPSLVVVYKGLVVWLEQMRAEREDD
mgnify:CR=1 FL=1